MFNKKQTAEIVDKLIELTQHNQIKWEAIDPEPYMKDPNSRVDLIYVAKHLGRRIRLYQQHYKYYFDEDKYVWDEQINIEFIDDYDNSLGMFPKTPNANDLFKAIQYQNPLVNSFYNDLFGK